MTNDNYKIDPKNVTKPIQLLAAWLVGLIAVDGSFLLAAARMDVGSWQSGALTVAAIANVPVFLIALFMLQTKFRPEMQGDEYYSEYLNKKTNEVITVNREEGIERQLAVIQSEIRPLINRAVISEDAKEGRQKKLAIGRLWKLALNRNMTDYTKIKEFLEERDIPISDTFGTGHKPPMRAIALADYLDIKSKHDLFKIALEIGIEKYTYIGRYEEDIIRESILIGSYGVAEHEISKELMEMMKKNPDEAELKEFEQIPA